MAEVETFEKDLGFKKFMSDLKKIKGSHVDVGVFGGRNPSGSSVVVGALSNEFGAKIPNRFGGEPIIIKERSFLRSTADANRQSYNDEIDEGLKAIAVGSRSPKAVLTSLGVRIRRDVRRKIRSLKTPANEPSTVARKGSSNPLMDEGTLRQRIEFKVEGA